MMRTPISSQYLKPFLHKRLEFFRFLHTRVSQPETIEELIQDLFLKIVEKGHTIQSEKHFLAWCYQVLRHSVQDYYRHRDVKQRALKNYHHEQAHQIEPNEQAQLCSCVNALLPTLKFEYVQTLKKVMLEEQSLDDFAKQANITRNHATVRLYRARNALRKKLLQYCGSCAKAGCLNCTCRKAFP